VHTMETTEITAKAHSNDSIKEDPFSVGPLKICSPLGIGTWAWGNKDWGYGSYDTSFTDKTIEESFGYLHEKGFVNFWDTAEIYAGGMSEQILGSCIAKYKDKSSNPVVVATKFLPYPWRLSKGSFREALVNSLKRLNLQSADLYQVHGPAYSLRSVEHWAEAMADVVKEGLAKAVGVSNYNADQVKRTHAALAKHGIPLASNQIEFSLLRNNAEHNGMLLVCKELGVALIAYSPLAMGRLTGKYNKQNPPPGGRKFSNFPMEEIEPLIERLREIGKNHNKSVAQTAINWVICKGAVPICGVKNVKQAEENMGALGWRLTPEEVTELDKLSRQGKWMFWQLDSR